MKLALRILAATLILVAPIMWGCVPGLQTTKPSGEGGAAAGPQQPGGPQEPGKIAKAQDKEGQGQLPPPPDYKSSDPGDKEARFEGPVDLAFREEINQSAMDFAKNIKNVKHVKTCFSKLYGPWYLILYIQKGKKIELQQFLWNSKTREWDYQYRQDEVPLKQLEFHVKGEVHDEKCFVLK